MNYAPIRKQDVKGCYHVWLKPRGPPLWWQVTNNEEPPPVYQQASKPSCGPGYSAPAHP